MYTFLANAASSGHALLGASAHRGRLCAGPWRGHLQGRSWPNVDDSPGGLAPLSVREGRKAPGRMKVTFAVQGPPVPLARPRFGKGRVYTPKRSQQHKTRIGYAALAVRPQGWQRKGAYRVQADFYVLKGRGDVDNYLKCVLDGLQGVLFNDDRDVLQVQARKILAVKDEMTVITVERIGECLKI